MARRTPKTEQPTETLDQEAVVEPTDAVEPEQPTETDDQDNESGQESETVEPTDNGQEATESKATDSKPEATESEADPVQAFREAFFAAISPDESDPALDAEALSAFLALPNRKRADGSTVRSNERNAVVSGLVDGGPMDAAAIGRLTRAGALSAKLASHEHAPAPEQGSAVLVARITALADMAADVVAWTRSLADPSGTTDDDYRTVVEQLTTFGGGDLDTRAARAFARLAFASDPNRTTDQESATWSSAFGGRRPNADTVPGRSTKSSGKRARGNGGRSLDQVPVGTELVDRYHGEHGPVMLRATVDERDGSHVLVSEDGHVFKSPTSATNALRQPFAKPGVRVSVNGWTGSWAVPDADGQPTKMKLADLVDNLTSTDDQDE